jgi:hypothetical protein
MSDPFVFENTVAVVGVVAVAVWLAVSAHGKNCHYNAHLVKRVYCSQE